MLNKCSACKEIKFDLLIRIRFPRAGFLCNKCYEDYCERAEIFPSIKGGFDKDGKYTYERNKLNNLEDIL